MRNAAVHVNSSPRAPQVRLRRRKIDYSSDQLGNQKAARSASDISHFIGYGILLLAALLIVLGSVTA
jgi:hypothetical protein